MPMALMGPRRMRLLSPAEKLRFVVECIYFARPDSFLFGCTSTTGDVRGEFSRTFIEPRQAMRDAKVRKKYNPNCAVLMDWRAVLVEDSIVRGTTLKNILHLIRDFKAKEVHVRVSSPPSKDSCYPGIDTAETRRLISHTKTVAQIRKFLGADTLGDLSEEGMPTNFLLRVGFCTCCFKGLTRIGTR